MPQGYHGATSDTPDNLLLDAGVIYFNYTDSTNLGTKVGATRGGAEWSLGRTMRNMEFDGELGPTKGMVRREEVNPTLSVELLEMTKDNLKKAIAGVSEDGDTLTGDEIDDDDYITNVTYLGVTKGGQEIRVTLENCLAEGDFSVSTEHRNEATLPVTFVAHFDFDEVDGDGNWQEPWEIEFIDNGSGHPAE